MGNEKRTRHCGMCINHGVSTPFKGHLPVCPFRNCSCHRCTLTRRRRMIVAKQIHILRKSRVSSASGSSAVGSVTHDTTTVAAPAVSAPKQEISVPGQRVLELASDWVQMNKHHLAHSSRASDTETSIIISRLLKLQVAHLKNLLVGLPDVRLDTAGAQQPRSHPRPDVPGLPVQERAPEPSHNNSSGSNHMHHGVANSYLYQHSFSTPGYSDLSNFLGQECTPERSRNSSPVNPGLPAGYMSQSAFQRHFDFLDSSLPDLSNLPSQECTPESSRNSSPVNNGLPTSYTSQFAFQGHFVRSNLPELVYAPSPACTPESSRNGSPVSHSYPNGQLGQIYFRGCFTAPSYPDLGDLPSQECTPEASRNTSPVSHASTGNFLGQSPFQDNLTPPSFPGLLTNFGSPTIDQSDLSAFMGQVTGGMDQYDVGYLPLQGLASHEAISQPAATVAIRTSCTQHIVSK